MVDNVNRWRGEVGLPKVPDLNAQPVKQAAVGAHEAALLDFAAPDPAAPGAKASAIAMVPLGRDVWFLKLIGPAKTVADQRANFDAFLKSLQFGEAGE